MISLLFPKFPDPTFFLLLRQPYWVYKRNLLGADFIPQIYPFYLHSTGSLNPTNNLFFFLTFSQ